MRQESEDHLSALSIVVAALLAVVTGATAAVLRTPELRNRFATTAPESAYTIGTMIDVPAELFKDNSHTIILFGRSGCGACTAVRPFHRKLAASVTGQAGIQMVLVTSGPDLTNETEYGDDLGIARPNIKLVAPGSFRVRRVPTLVVVDRTGRVMGAWEGAGTAQRDMEIEALVNSLQRQHH